MILDCYYAISLEIFLDNCLLVIHIWVFHLLYEYKIYQKSCFLITQNGQRSNSIYLLEKEVYLLKEIISAS